LKKSDINIDRTPISDIIKTSTEGKAVKQNFKLKGAKQWQTQKQKSLISKKI